MRDAKICEYCDAVSGIDDEIEHESWCPEVLNKEQEVQVSDTTEAEHSAEPSLPNLDNFKEQLEKEAKTYANVFENHNESEYFIDVKGAAEADYKAGGEFAENFFLPIIEKLKEENRQLQQEKEKQAIDIEHLKRELDNLKHPF
jgi:hypothetical protein